MLIVSSPESEEDGEDTLVMDKKGRMVRKSVIKKRKEKRKRKKVGFQIQSPLPPQHNCIEWLRYSYLSHISHPQETGLSNSMRFEMSAEAEAQHEKMKEEVVSCFYCITLEWYFFNHSPSLDGAAGEGKGSC